MNDIKSYPPPLSQTFMSPQLSRMNNQNTSGNNQKTLRRKTLHKSNQQNKSGSAFHRSRSSNFIKCFHHFFYSFLY